MRRARGAAGWFAFGVRLFVVALALGLLLVAIAPVDFVRWLGAAAAVGSALGIAMSLAGLRLEASPGWQSTARRPR